MPAPVSATILFDGVCNLCNGFVQFLIRHDPHGRFRFAALQSDAGQALLAAHGQPHLAAASVSPDSIVVVEGRQVYTHSAAMLRIARHLGGGWRLAAMGWLLPRPWRDALYRYVARHRYRWFGRQESCWLPTPALFYCGGWPVLGALVLAPVGGGATRIVSAGAVPPTFVAAESVPSVLDGVEVDVSVAWLPPHADRKSPPPSSAAHAKDLS